MSDYKSHEMHAAMKKAVKRQKDVKSKIKDPKTHWKEKRAKRNEQIKKVVAYGLIPTAVLTVIISLVLTGTVRFGDPKPLTKALADPAQALTLELGSFSLSEVPPEVEQLTALRELVLENNEITQVPVSVTTLSNLTVLNLQYNQVGKLPPEIGQLSNLTALRLKSNKLVSLPDEITKLSKLESLDVTRNQLQEVPRNLGALTKLKGLRLGGNNLTTLPDSIGKLVLLEGLDISGNPISELPDLSTLTKLRGIKIANTRLSPEAVEKLKSQLPDVRISQ